MKKKLFSAIILVVMICVGISVGTSVTYAFAAEQGTAEVGYFENQNRSIAVYDAARRRLTSDYSRATGVWMSTNTTYYGNGGWWLRSPSDSSSGGARYVSTYGYVSSSNDVSYTDRGVVPALRLRLS